METILLSNQLDLAKQCLDSYLCLYSFISPGLSRSELSQLHRLPFSGINQKALKLFRTPAKAVARAKQLAREATRGITRSVRSKLTGFEGVIGFKLTISKTSLRTAVHRLSSA